MSRIESIINLITSILSKYGYTWKISQEEDEQVNIIAFECSVDGEKLLWLQVFVPIDESEPWNANLLTYSDYGDWDTYTDEEEFPGVNNLVTYQKDNYNINIDIDNFKDHGNSVLNWIEFYALAAPQISYGDSEKAKNDLHKNLIQSDKPGVYIFKVTINRDDIQAKVTLRIWAHNSAEAQEQLVTSPVIEDFKLIDFVETKLPVDTDDWWKTGGSPPTFTPDDIADNFE